MSRSGTLNPEKIEIAEEKSETGTGDMARRRSLPAVNISTLERLQQQDLAQGIEISYVPSIQIRKLVTPLMQLPKEVGSKQKRAWPTVCRFFSRKEKDCFLDCKEIL